MSFSLFTCFVITIRKSNRISITEDKLLLQEPVDDVYKQRYKPIYLSMSILTAAFSGNYVNFSVFDLYGDPVLENVVQRTVQLALSIPADELQAYPKVRRAFYSFIEQITQHIFFKFVLKMDTKHFAAIIDFLQKGLNTTDHFNTCCQALDNLFTYFYQCLKKNSDMLLTFQSFISSFGNIVAKFMRLLLEILLYVDTASHWVISKPLLCLILIDPEVLSPPLLLSFTLSFLTKPHCRSSKAWRVISLHFLPLWSPRPSLPSLIL